MDIYAKDNIFRGEGGIGVSIFGLNCYVGLPIKGSHSFVGSYRRGHSYLMTKINNREDSEYETENIFGKMNLKLNKLHNLRILGLFDEYEFSHEDGFSSNSKNRITGISLTSVFAKNLVTKFSVSHVNYKALYQVKDIFQKEIKDIIYQARFNVSLDLESHFFEFGTDVQNRKIDIAIEIPNINSDFYQAQGGKRLGFYFSDKFRAAANLYVKLGGRIYSLDLNGYKLSFDPRVSIACLITKNNILRFSSGVYHQFGDYFTLNENIDLKPKRANHYSLSYDKISEDTSLRLSLYNKEYKNLFLNNDQGIVSNEGHGYARGLEFFVKRKKKQYDFLFVYNFINSKRKENDVNFLARSPYEIDHSLTGIFTFKFKNSSIGIRFSYASGLPFTPLEDREWDNENLVYSPVWGEPYSQRYPSYKRMDINGSHIFSYKNRLIVFYFGVTNLLNNKNILRYEYSDDYSVRKNQYSIFGRSIFVGIYLPLF